MVFKLHPVKDRDVILNLNTVSDSYIFASINILAEGAILPDVRSPLNMTKVPDFRPFPYGNARINIAAFMNIKLLTHFQIVP